MSITNDIILYIENLNKWNCVGKWLDVSPSTRRLFLRRENLKVIIDSFLNHNLPQLPNWILKSIPLSDNLMDIVPDCLKNLQNTMMSILTSDDRIIIYDRFLITGGFAVSCVFGTDYSDIDIWITGDNPRISDGKYDIIQCKNIESEISNFDISYCQVGVLFERINGMVTPIRTYFTIISIFIILQ